MVILDTGNTYFVHILLTLRSSSVRPIPNVLDIFLSPLRGPKRKTL